MTTDEIKQAYNMHSILDRYGLKSNRAGFSQCPFHTTDKHASLKIYDKDYHCFSCGAHGDIFTFVQNMDNLSFAEAFGVLGGTYKPNATTRARIVREQQAREHKRAIDTALDCWRSVRLNQVCSLIHAYEAALHDCTPLTDTWTVAMNALQLAEYRYQIIAFGGREEWVEMREANG